jgi:hypothetical protein
MFGDEDLTPKRASSRRSLLGAGIYVEDGLGCSAMSSRAASRWPVADARPNRPTPHGDAPGDQQPPFIAPTLPQRIRYVEGAGLRVLTWRDSNRGSSCTGGWWPEPLIAMAAAYTEGVIAQSHHRNLVV